MPNFKLTLCYDGTRWQGWQRQTRTPRTIQGKLEALLTRLLEQPVEVAGSGRTDAGTHAAGQVVSFRAKTRRTPAELLADLRRYLPEDIGAIALEEAPPRFHARLSCVGKTYVYRLWTGEEPCVFRRQYVWPFREKLDLEAMARAAELLCGTHDYRSFCSLKKYKKSTVRTVESITFRQEGPELQVFFTGDGFLYHMVRILMGTLLEVGRGKRKPEEMPALLEAGDRELAGPTVPACGLCLERVYYPGDRPAGETEHRETPHK